MADGGILFVACALAFVVGYVVGAVRVSRFVSKQLTSVQANMKNIEQYSHDLGQIYARLENKGQEQERS
jgi:uncharacterized membrane-anchored protein YhcB (DUF1043 family)